MENNMDVMLEFFLIRQSVVVRAHLPSVECVWIITLLCQVLSYV